jgi:hypothetical protein
MKKTSIFIALSVLVLLIVLPVIGSVNDLSSNYTVLVSTLRASGSPIPPNPPPNAPTLHVLTASGSPIPPNPPKPSMLTARGLLHV